MDRSYSLIRAKAGALVALATIVCPLALKAQLNVSAVNTPYTINFDGTVSGVSNGAFAGSGFQPTPTSGRLDSDAWASTGWSDGSLAFGGTRTTASTDYTRGTTAPGNLPIAVGGIWSFGGAGITGRALGFQQAATDANPGTITLRVRNTTGSTLTAFDISYNAYYRNDEDRSSTFNLRYSDDNTTYTSVPALDLTTPGPLVGTSWVANARSTTITGVNVPNNGFFYIRWALGTAGGSGNWDEIALDDISVTGRAWTMVRLTSSSTTAGENSGTTSITASIINPDPVLSTSVDLVLTSGPAARINNYTTQTLTFPGGSLANQSQTITITDNGDCDGDATIVLGLQNATGGIGTAGIGRPNTFTLTVDDDETGPGPATGQAFDGGVNDNLSITTGGANVSTNAGAGDTPANQRIYNGSSSWQVRNATATLQLAAADVQDWSNIILSARLSSTSSSATGGADAGDSVAFYVSLNGGAFPLDPDVRISGNSNGRWGYSGGTVIATGTAGTPVNYTSNLAGNIYAQVQISVPNGTTSVELKVVARNNDNTEIWNIDDIQLTGTLCSQVYYSRANGSEATATWSTARTGSPAPSTVTFSKNKSMVVQNGHTVTTAGSTIAVRDLMVETGGALALGGTATVDIHGSSFTLDGPVTAADDHIRIRSTASCSMSGSQTSLSVADLTVNGGGLVVGIDTVNLTGTLQLTQGAFDANGNLVALRSGPSATARLGTVGASASYVGDLLLERYIPAGNTDWRLLSCPIQGRTFWAWKDDFYTAGFPGSHYPNFYQNNVLWPSIRKYDETNPGGGSGAGLIGIGNITDAITVGQGFSAWSGDNYFTTQAFTIDVKGPPQIASTPFTLPMTWTNSGHPSVDGLNLVGNPVPSPIDFSLVARGADVANFYYIYDPGSGTNAVWDEANNLGTLGANGNIQSSQGFWLKANGPAITTTVSEAAKVLEPINGGIFSQEQETRPIVRLRLANTATARADEAIIQFINGEPVAGSNDVDKFPFVHPEAVTIASNTADGASMAINAFGPLTGAVDIEVTVDAEVDGQHTITVSDLFDLGGRACLSLEDLHTGITTVLSEGASYTFDLLAADPVQPARFVLHVGAPIEQVKQDVTCAGAADGRIEVNGTGNGPWDYTLADMFGNVLDQVTTASTHTFTDLAPGNYMVTVDGGTGCGAITGLVEVLEPTILGTQVSSTATSCAVATDGMLEAMVTGGTAPYMVAWSNGGTGAELTDLPVGSYSATVTDAKGCTSTVNGIMVEAGMDPVAEFEATPASVLTNEPVDFFNSSTYGLQYTWDLGDGTQSNEGEPVHSYMQPGLYTVTLTVENGDCSAIVTHDVAVSITTAIAEQTAAGITAWCEGGQFVVQWQVDGSSALQADVIDATGKMVVSRQARGSSGRFTVDVQDLPAGIYFLRATCGGRQRTFRLPMIR